MDISRVIAEGSVTPTGSPIKMNVNAVEASGQQIQMGDQIYYIGKYGLTIGNVMAAKVVTRRNYSRDYDQMTEKTVTRVRVTISHTAEPQGVWAVKNAWVDSNRVFVV